MDYIDGSGFWLAGLGTAAPTPPAVTTDESYKPVWRPRRRAWWWIVLPWLGMYGA